MALWKTVAQALEDDITSGKHSPGDELPSEAELAREHGVSRNTVRRALEHLTTRGLIRGEGTARRRVAERVLLEIHVTRPASRVAGGQSPTPGADSWAHDVAALGLEAGVELSVWAAEAGGMAGWLELDPRDQVVVREQLRTAAGRPHNLAAWWFPRLIAAGTKLVYPDDITEGSVPYLGGIGYAPVTFTVEIEARMPTVHEAGRLLIAPGVPVLVEYRTGATQFSRQVVFCSVTIWPGDRTRLLVDL